jgi:hypothetical protein
MEPASTADIRTYVEPTGMSYNANVEKNYNITNCLACF